MGSTPTIHRSSAPAPRRIRPGASCDKSRNHRVTRGSAGRRAGQCCQRCGILAEFPGGRECVVCIDVTENGEADVVHVALALGAAPRLACRLDGRQEQPNQDADDADHNEQFDQRKTLATMPTTATIHERSFHKREVSPKLIVPMSCLVRQARLNVVIWSV